MKVANAEEPIVAVPITSPVVQVHVPLGTVPVEVRNVTVEPDDTRRLCERYHPYHHPLKYLGIEFYS